MRLPIRLAGVIVLGLALSACADGEDAGGATPDPTSASGTTAPQRTAIDARPVALPFEEGLHWRIAVAPDGKSALVAWSAGFFPRTRESTIYEVTRAPDGAWTDPVQPSFVSDSTADIDPYYTADGSRVWFSSIRPTANAPRSDVELWYVDRLQDGSWGEPVHAAELGSDGDELYPSIGGDGALYFASDRGGRGFDIWRAEPNGDGGWAPPAVLPPPVTASTWEFNPAFTPDGSRMVFTAHGRPGGAGAGDLFVTRVDGDTWSEPLPLESVNTRGDEYHPAFSPDGATLYFVRDGVLHEVPVSATELD